MAWNKGQERERQVKAGRGRGSARTGAMQGIRCIVKVCHHTSTLTTIEDANTPRVSIFPL